ncbi:MAG: hypothetical protein IH623_06330 [Verrucomicrobia bacterium]|nr:hypothetical protein [Verrucomicrobiota bacterium]
MNFITQPFRRIRQMPETLAALSCMFMLFGLLGLVAALLPISDWTYEGRSISYQEFWRSGGGIVVTATCLAMILFAVAFYRAQRWVCYAVPLGFVGLTIYAALRADALFPYQWIGSLFWVFLSYWYFNRKRKVVAYFSGLSSAEPDGPANGSQPIRSETNRASSAAGSRRCVRLHAE